ncbi:MAG: RNA polymerase sigma factor [Salaquimonas sp.]
MPEKDKKIDRKSTAGSPKKPLAPALEVAMNAHYSDFKRYLQRRLPDKATAEDVLQNFYVRVMLSETQLRDERSAIGWLYTVLRSVLMDHFRRDKVRIQGDSNYVQEQLVLETNSIDPEQRDNICKCVHGLLFELPAEQAELLRRVDFLEQSREIVGNDMAISQQNLRVRLHRARTAIGAALKRHCGACCQTGYRDCFCDSECTHA